LASPNNLEPVLFIAYTVIAVLLTLLLVLSADAKLTKNQPVVDGLTGLGVPLGSFPFPLTGSQRHRVGETGRRSSSGPTDNGTRSCPIS
jgi:hypothetical protein